jgi:hypothetical protein
MIYIETQEEARNSFQFRAVRKAVKLKYRWVIDILPPSDADVKRYKSLFFMDLLVDPFILSKELELPLANHIINGVRNKEERWSTTMITFFKFKGMEDIESAKEDVRDLQNMVQEYCGGVFKSKGVPDEIRLKNYFDVGISEYIIPPTLNIPPDFTNNYGIGGEVDDDDDDM